jgi:3-oxoacyl-[acyl-carrier-protein] synthase II
MSTRRVVCTGVGMVSPLGVGVRRSWSALLQSKSGIVPLKAEHSFEGCQSRVAAYVPDDELKEELGRPEHEYMTKTSRQLSRATKLAMLASHEALGSAKLLDESGQLIEKYRYRTGVAIGQGMVDFEDVYDNGKLLAGANFRRMSPFFMTRALMNMSAGNVSIRYKINGPNHCVSTACATGAHSIGDAFNFIRCHQADIMICGSTEASINSIAMAGFERLKALSTKFNDNPTTSSRPFDEARCGFVIGEGSGVVILEEREHALKRGLTEEEIHCEILGYGVSADAYHLTAPAPNGLGASLCMRNALNSARLEPSEIGHINAHATSTPIGDDIECTAIEELFGSGDQTDINNLSVTSCKSSIGHLLGGAGSVESIFGILSCKEAILPPTLNLVDPLKTPRNLIRFIQDRPVPWSADRRILIKNSFGFGGTNASLIICNNH